MPRGRGRRHSIRSSRGSRRMSGSSRVKVPENHTPVAYFHEVFVVSKAELTTKMSKAVYQTADEMETFVTANVDHVPPHATADICEDLEAQMASSGHVTCESVTVFVMKVRRDANKVFNEHRFDKVKDILNADIFKEGFHNFLKGEHCEELLMLLDKIETTLKMSKPEDIARSNKEIFDTFIATGSPMEVNLDPKLQDKLEVNYRKPEKRTDKLLFLPAKKELFSLLEFEFARFKESDDYSDLEYIARENDVDKWKSNFNNILHDQLGRRVLLNFMMMEKNEENLLFFMAVQKMKSLTDPQEIKDYNKVIFETFIGSSEESAIPDDDDVGTEPPTGHVNIDWPVKADIERNLAKNPESKTIFDKAERAIFHSMMDESWPRFRESRLLQEYKKDKQSTTLGDAGANEADTSLTPAAPAKKKGKLKSIFSKGSSKA